MAPGIIYFLLVVGSKREKLKSVSVISGAKIQKSLKRFAFLKLACDLKMVAWVYKR